MGCACSKAVDSAEEFSKKGGPGDNHSVGISKSATQAGTAMENGKFSSLQQSSEADTAKPISKEAQPNAGGSDDAPLAFPLPPVPVDDCERLNTLRSLNVLDTPPDSQLDVVTETIQRLFDTPISYISFVDENRQWMKSGVGLGGVQETPREAAFCAWTITQPRVLVIEDAHEDARFANNPFVAQAPNVRFYAGAPLVTSNGHIVGSLCLMDVKPRKLNAWECNLLANFAEVVMRHIEKPHANRLQAELFELEPHDFGPGPKSCNESCNDKVLRAFGSTAKAPTAKVLRSSNCYAEALTLCRLTAQGGELIWANEDWLEETGIREVGALGEKLSKFVALSEKGGVDPLVAAWEQRSNAFSAVGTLKASGRAVEVEFRSAHLGHVNDFKPLVAIPNSVDSGEKPQDLLYFVTWRSGRTVIEEVEEEADIEDVEDEDVDDEDSDEEQPKLQMSIKRDESTWRWENGGPFEGVVTGPLLGRGGFGTVYRGEWIGEQVAVKVNRTPKGDKSSDRMTEIDLCNAKLEHENIVKMIKSVSRTMQVMVPQRGGVHSVTDMEESWVVMEYCNLSTLLEAVERGWLRVPHFDPRGAPHMTFILSTAREIATALVYLHSNNILHGALTGNNVLLKRAVVDTRRFTAKVCDFGLSRRVQVASSAEQPDAVPQPKGVPEMLSEGPLALSTDVYALGVLLWEMYNGQRSWAGMSGVQVMFTVAVHEKVMHFPKDTPKDYVELTRSCLAIASSDRPTASQVLERLNKMASAI